MNFEDCDVYKVSEYEKKLVTKNGRVFTFITYNGETKLLSEWCDITGIPYTTLQGRLKRLQPGESIDIVFSKKNGNLFKRRRRKK